jgi:hypothetical protein
MNEEFLTIEDFDSLCRSHEQHLENIRLEILNTTEAIYLFNSIDQVVHYNDEVLNDFGRIREEINVSIAENADSEKSINPQIIFELHSKIEEVGTNENTFLKDIQNNLLALLTFISSKHEYTQLELRLSSCANLFF